MKVRSICILLAALRACTLLRSFAAVSVCDMLVIGWREQAIREAVYVPSARA